MSSNLRAGLIRLAHANPELRPHLLPLLKEAAKAPVKMEARLIQINDRVKDFDGSFRVVKTVEVTKDLVKVTFKDGGRINADPNDMVTVQR
jgi:hypothetical protein